MQTIQTTTIGKRAEAEAARYLEAHGFVVVDRNWRRKTCEIDIVARKQRTVYFVEVKYRSSDEYGGGLEYITPTKLKQMAYVASRWVAECKWTGEYVLSAIEVGGDQFEVTDFVESIEIG